MYIFNYLRGGLRNCEGIGTRPGSSNAGIPAHFLGSRGDLGLLGLPSFSGRRMNVFSGLSVAALEARDG